MGDIHGMPKDALHKQCQGHAVNVKTGMWRQKCQNTYSNSGDKFQHGDAV